MIYFATILTAFITSTSIYFKCIEEKDGKNEWKEFFLRGKTFHRPVLTNAGVIIGALFVLSFFLSLYLVHGNEQEQTNVKTERDDAKTERHKAEKERDEAKEGRRAAEKAFGETKENLIKVSTQLGITKANLENLKNGLGVANVGIGLIEGEVKKKLPVFIENAVIKSEGKITAYVNKEITRSGEFISQTTEKAVEDSREYITNTTKKAVENSEKFITDTTRKAINSASTDITSATTNAINEASKESIRNISTTIELEVMQIPFRVLAKTSYRFAGSLKNLSIQVDDVSLKHRFEVKIIDDSGMELEKKVICPPKAKECTNENPPWFISFSYKGQQYKIEMYADAPTNVFGQANDYLQCRFVETNLNSVPMPSRVK